MISNENVLYMEFIQAISVRMGMKLAAAIEEELEF